MRPTMEICSELNGCIEYVKSNRILENISDAGRGQLFVKFLMWVVCKNPNLPHNEADYAATTNFGGILPMSDPAPVECVEVREEMEALQALVTAYEFANIYLRTLLRSEGPLLPEMEALIHRKYSAMQDAVAVLSWVLQRQGNNLPSLLLREKNKTIFND